MLALVGPYTNFYQPCVIVIIFNNPLSDNNIEWHEEEAGTTSEPLPHVRNSCSRGSVSVSPSSSPRVKFTHGTGVQYHHGTAIAPLQNTIGRNPSAGPTRSRSAYLHLQANIVDAVTFLSSRWFSKTAA